MSNFSPHQVPPPYQLGPSMNDPPTATKHSSPAAMAAAAAQQRQHNELCCTYANHTPQPLPGYTTKSHFASRTESRMRTPPAVPQPSYSRNADAVRPLSTEATGSEQSSPSLAGINFSAIPSPNVPQPPQMVVRAPMMTYNLPPSIEGPSSATATINDVRGRITETRTSTTPAPVSLVAKYEGDATTRPLFPVDSPQEMDAEGGEDSMLPPAGFTSITHSVHHSAQNNDAVVVSDYNCPSGDRYGAPVTSEMTQTAFSSLPYVASMSHEDLDAMQTPVEPAYTTPVSTLYATVPGSVTPPAMMSVGDPVDLTNTPLRDSTTPFNGSTTTMCVANYSVSGPMAMNTSLSQPPPGAIPCAPSFITGHRDVGAELGRGTPSMVRRRSLANSVGIAEVEFGELSTSGGSQQLKTVRPMLKRNGLRPEPLSEDTVNISNGSTDDSAKNISPTVQAAIVGSPLTAAPRSPPRHRTCTSSSGRPPTPRSVSNTPMHSSFRHDMSESVNLRRSGSVVSSASQRNEDAFEMQHRKLLVTATSVLQQLRGVVAAQEARDQESLIVIRVSPTAASHVVKTAKATLWRVWARILALPVAFRVALLRKMGKEVPETILEQSLASPDRRRRSVSTSRDTVAAPARSPLRLDVATPPSTSFGSQPQGLDSNAPSPDGRKSVRIGTPGGPNDLEDESSIIVPLLPQSRQWHSLPVAAPQTNVTPQSQVIQASSRFGTPPSMGAATVAGSPTTPQTQQIRTFASEATQDSNTRAFVSRRTFSLLATFIGAASRRLAPVFVILVIVANLIGMLLGRPGYADALKAPLRAVMRHLRTMRPQTIA